MALVSRRVRLQAILMHTLCVAALGRSSRLSNKPSKVQLSRVIASL